MNTSATSFSACTCRPSIVLGGFESKAPNDRLCQETPNFKIFHDAVRGEFRHDEPITAADWDEVRSLWYKYMKENQQ
jgi:hypothetical protein